MKYIVMQVIVRGIEIEFPIIFPDLLVHSDMAKSAAILIGRQYNTEEVKAVSAGFVNSIEVGRAECHGESTSLNLKSRFEDNALMRFCDYGGMVK